MSRMTCQVRDAHRYGCRTRRATSGLVRHRSIMVSGADDRARSLVRSDLELFAAWRCVPRRARTVARHATQGGGADDGMPEDVLSARTGSAWSAKEHLAHLDDLHDLDEKRFAQYLAREGTLAAADVTNERTHTANHNATSVLQILTRLQTHRQALVARMELATAEDVETVCVHPRLGQRLRLIDWACFVAEHDDHHLALARLAIRSAVVTLT